jgi:hypothetical protein
MAGYSNAGIMALTRQPIGKLRSDDVRPRDLKPRLRR